MNRMEAIGWVLAVGSEGLRLSQAKTLNELVGTAIRVGRVSLAEIGRQLEGPAAAKHRIKRCWRFTANNRLVVSDAMQGVLRQLRKRKHWKKKPLLGAMDGTEVCDFHTLMLAAVMQGRAVPLLWASYPEWVLHKSQNKLEEGLRVLLKSLMPEGVRVILLADRGCGRTGLARPCQQLGFHYVIRIKPDVWINSADFRGKLLDFPVKKGIGRLLRNVAFRQERPVQQHIVIRWPEGLPKDRDECWFLMTDLARGPKVLSELYGKRMTVEELFRDDKSRRNGFALRNTQITKPERFDRLLLILALAYFLLAGLGRVACQRYRPGTWCSSNRSKECSVFTIGRTMLDRREVSAAVAFAAILQAAPNWG